MRFSLALVAVVALALPLAAQADFECYALGRFPLPGPTNCENLLCNNLGTTGMTGVSVSPSCGFPTSGNQYARIDGNGPFSVPPGGPVTYPLPNSVTELRVPIPTGSTQVAFCWDFFNSESFASSFNDGASVSVVSAAGILVQTLVYADTNTLPGPCVDFSFFFSTESGQPGPQGYQLALPTLSAGDYLSFASWNGGDNSVASHAKIDDVKFSGAPSCPLVPPPPGNDDCANAILVNSGTNGPFSTVSATSGAVTASCGFGADVADVWFLFVPACTVSYDIDTCGSDYNTILSVYDGCGGNELACNDDDFSLACAVNFTESRVSVPVVAGTPYWIRVAGNGFFGGAQGNVTLNINQQMTFTLTTAGFGTVGYQIAGGPSNGLFFAAITLNGGSFPNGSFFGIDISLQEIANEFSFGAPFTGTLSACGTASFGPVSGLPSGLALYGTALGFPGPTFGIPSATSQSPSSIVIP